MKKILIYIFILIVSVFVLCAFKSNTTNDDAISYFEDTNALKNRLIKAHITEYHYQITKKYPHYKNSFTEGLQLNHDYLYESSGLYGLSVIRKINLNTNKIMQEYHLPKDYFGEGITLLGDNLYQLSYREHTGFVYNKNTLRLKKIFHYPGEGWGLTTDGKELIMSQGSGTLTYINPMSLKPTHSLVVKFKGQDINCLNELEYVNGKIFANVWPAQIIVIISAKTGEIQGWLNIENLKYHCADENECVANGIAYDKKNNTLLVTGKYWPYLYSLKLSV